jgi:plasmid stabilization system protein ParE
MKIIWQSNAKKGRTQVASYIYRRFGIRRVKEFRLEVDRVAKMIMLHPNIGPIDPLFADRPVTYRSIIINGLSKMVYRVDDEIIHIVAFWDTRKEPQAQAEQTKN